MEALRPLMSAAIRLYFARRLDLAVDITCKAMLPAPAALGVALSCAARLWVAAQVAKESRQSKEVDAEASGNSEAALPPPGGSDSDEMQRQRPSPKGLGSGLPPLLLPCAPPGGLGSNSVQPIGLPMMLVGQSAARAPFLAMRGDRLVRGLAGLAASLLLCRSVRTPFTGRLARLPPKAVEFLYSSVVGPAAAISYLTTSGAGQAAGASNCTLCRRHGPALKQLYMQLREVGDGEARRGGHGITFASRGPSVEAVQRPDINACCLPGGIVFVHSLIKAVQGQHNSLAFVLGHEVGHAIGRHSLERATFTYIGIFVIDALVGLAERLLRSADVSGEDNEERSGAWLRALDGVLQSGLYMLQLCQSRCHEYEADHLALALGTGAGLSRSVLFSGAQDVLHNFMRMEAGAGGGLAPAVRGVSDSPLSTHPAAANRLRRLTELYGGRAA